MLNSRSPSMAICQAHAPVPTGKRATTAAGFRHPVGTFPPHWWQRPASWGSSSPNRAAVTPSAHGVGASSLAANLATVRSSAGIPLQVSPAATVSGKRQRSPFSTSRVFSLPQLLTMWRQNTAAPRRAVTYGLLSSSSDGTYACRSRSALGTPAFTIRAVRVEGYGDNGRGSLSPGLLPATGLDRRLRFLAPQIVFPLLSEHRERRSRP